MKWKKVKGTEYYEVSNTGLVRNSNTGRIRKPKFTNGYVVLILRVNGNLRTCRVHRLVAAAFLPNPKNKPEVHHIDFNKQNNCVDNLMWAEGYLNKQFNKGKYVKPDMFNIKTLELIYKDDKDITIGEFISKLKKLK